MAKRVLIVEDEPNIAESLLFLLEQAGFETAQEANGEQALDALLVDPPDVVVLDMMLPGMNGYAVLKALRAEARTAALPVLMLTAKGQPRDKAEALDCGASRFMTKPYANAELVAAVEELAAGG